MKLYDVTLRDGNHALRHTLTTEMVASYCKVADLSVSWAVEVGHGNGLGASSFLVGKSSSSDKDLLQTARDNLKNKLLAVHSIPGFSTVKRDLIPAIDLGVDVFRVATHVTEADVAQTQVEFLKEREKIVHGVLMMSHMSTISEFVESAKLMREFGADAVIFMDSAGYFRGNDVQQRVQALKVEIGIEVGFHAHNNLGLGVSNALTASRAGAEIIDGATMGLGAGAGNAQLENIYAAGIASHSQTTNEELEVYLRLSGLIETNFSDSLPIPSASSIRSGVSGVFSGYAPHVAIAASEFGIPESVLWIEIGKRKLVAGQESMIREIALDLMNL